MVLTNAVGVAFLATLLSVDADGVTCVFPEDGATNTLAFAQLSPESVRAVCREKGYVRVPPTVSASVEMARRELARTAQLAADGRLDGTAAAQRRTRILTALLRRCDEKGVARDDARAIAARLAAETGGRE